MKQLGLAAVLALVSTSAFAGSFEIPINGGVARIHFGTKCRDRVCGSVSWSGRGERREFKLPAISPRTISKLIDGRAGGLGLSALNDQSDTDTSATKPRPLSDAAGKRKSPSSESSSSTASETSFVDRVPPAPSSSSEPETTIRPAPSVDATPEGESSTRGLRSPGRAEPKVAAVSPAKTSATGEKTSPSPIGEWLIEGGEGRVRIEACGDNLCGFVSGVKKFGDKDRNNPNPALRNRSIVGVPVLIDMKPKGNRWSGRVYNVKDGKNYGATMSLKGEDALRIEGCAFGGLICGGQTWTRAN